MKKTSPHHRDQPIQHTENYTTDAINALNHIPSELPRDEWVRIATAFKTAGGDFDTFDTWSSTASNYKPKDCQSLWRSISNVGGIGAGTLFYIAKYYGYKSTRSNVKVDMYAVKEQARLRQQAEYEVKQRNYVLAQQKAKSLLGKCNSASPDHPYLIKKQIRPEFMPMVNTNNQLVIPVMDLQNTVHSLQHIDANGNKKFLKNGAVKGNFYELRPRYKNKNKDVIAICEGYATAITVGKYYIRNSSVVIAFNAGNLLPVAKVFRAAFPDSTIIIAGDNDKSGVGQRKANEVALAINGWYLLPRFERDEQGSDWNDRWVLDNIEVTS